MKVISDDFRFPDDVYDRIWEPSIRGDMIALSTNLTFDSGVPDTWLRTPTVVMETAVRCINASAPIELRWQAPDQSTKYFTYMHFGEVEQLQANQTREFVVKLNGVTTSTLIVPSYLYSTIIYNIQSVTGDWFNYTIERTVNSTLPPIINALEVFTVKEFLQSETDQADGTFPIMLHYILTC